MMSEKKSFDLAAVLKEVSTLDTSERERIEYIDADSIETDPSNFYHVCKVPELASNIEIVGLQQPIRVRPIGKDRYRIVSGHRRKAAIALLLSEGKEQFRQIPCIVENDQCSEAMRKLKLIYANSDTREMSSAEKMKQAEEVEMLLYQLKEEGVEFPGRMRDHVAQACKMSATKLARLKVIRDNLAADYQQPFEKQQITEAVAYALARLPQDFQQRLFRVVSPQKLIGGALEQIVEKYASGCRWETELQCPNGKPCTHADAALRHDLADCWRMCGANKCCLTCTYASDDCSPCPNMCSKAKEKRSAARAEEDAQQKSIQQKTTNKYQRITQENAKRLIPVIDAVGLANDVVLPIERYGSITVKQIREFANGIFDDSYRWNYARIDQDSLSGAKATAKILKCSTDFLFGLTEDPAPKAGSASGVQWMPGSARPQKAVLLAVVLFAIEGMASPIYKIAEWRADAWHFPNSGATIDAECLKWLPLEEESQ